ncbi:hypothetical protein [Prevotella pallens]|uniref:hypothetical protein n=1 Tax=Prevotella pallens TaxID=60133 RepID=UPI0028D0B13E|nr:hypothetical protein [Prevotella pallens]
MLGYGRDESAPTPNGVFCGHFVECSPRYCNPFVAKWQTVRSCRGRFIVPAYMETPMKW